MTTPMVWISTTAPDLTLNEGHPGPHWQLVGTIDPSQERDLYKHVQVAIGVQASAPPISGFYIHGDPESQWIQDAKEDPGAQAPFWVAIDPWGEQRQTTIGAREIYLVTTSRATVTTGLTRRPPTPHPGYVVKPVIVGIKVRQAEGKGVFADYRAESGLARPPA